jgi:FMN phosphatase YigB (HAD superfamily)
MIATDSPTIEAVLWDIGQVIYPSPFERFDELEDRLGIPHETLLRGPFSAAGDPEYKLVDAGLREEPGYWHDLEATGRTVRPDFDMHSSLRDLGWRGQGRPVVVALLNEIPAKFRQAVLTNDATAFLGPSWRKDWELRHLFEVIIDSLDLGVRKPDPVAYESAAAALGLEPSRVLFVDDLTVNVVGARKTGMHAFRFDTTNPTESVAQLRSLLLPTSG